MKVIAKVPLGILFCLFTIGHITESSCNVALPDIAKYFNINGNISQITSSISFSGFATGILCLGRVSDIFGRRPIIFFGLILYVIASLGSYFAPNLQTLMILKFISSFGASVGSVVAQAMARDSYRGNELSYIYATMFIYLSFVPFSGATIGGYIVEYGGWKNVFLFLSCFTFTIIILCYFYLPETNPYLENPNLSRYFTILKVVISDKKSLSYAFLIGAINGMTFGFYIEAPFIFIDLLGFTPSKYGKLIFSLAIASVAASFLNRYWMKKLTGSNVIIIRGLFLLLIASILLNISAYFLDKNMNHNLAVGLIFFPMIIHMFGHAFIVPLCLRYALEDYAKVTGSAGSIFGFLYYMIVAIITFSISKIHSDNINKFALLYIILGILCIIAYYIVRNMHNQEDVE